MYILIFAVSVYCKVIVIVSYILCMRVLQNPGGVLEDLVGGTWNYFRLKKKGETEYYQDPILKGKSI